MSYLDQCRQEALHQTLNMKHEIEPTCEEEENPPLCAGCRVRITDKFYLCALERKWHASCLKCTECGVNLENEASCFQKEGHIFCRDDYLRLYGGSRTCARCQVDISPNDLVMKHAIVFFTWTALDVQPVIPHYRKVISLECLKISCTVEFTLKP